MAFHLIEGYSPLFLFFFSGLDTSDLTHSEKWKRLSKFWPKSPDRLIVLSLIYAIISDQQYWISARYQQDFDNGLSSVMSERFYQQALALYPDIGTVNMSHLMTKPTKWLCAQRRPRSAWESSFFMRTVNTLIRLGGCPGWSESSLGTHVILLVLTWCGSYVFYCSELVFTGAS